MKAFVAPVAAVRVSWEHTLTPPWEAYEELR
jgi:hypothetical protein